MGGCAAAAAAATAAALQSRLTLSAGNLIMKIQLFPTILIYCSPEHRKVAASSQLMQLLFQRRAADRPAGWLMMIIVLSSPTATQSCLELGGTSQMGFVCFSKPARLMPTEEASQLRATIDNSSAISMIIISLLYQPL